MTDGNPQLENGYTRIANELQVALAKAMAQGIITGKERAVVDWIIRYTYGFHEKNGYFHTSFIAKSLELSMSWVSQILKSLEEKKIIIRNGVEIKINKYYLEWSKNIEDSHRVTNLYVIQADTGLIKIGISNNPEERLKQIQAGSPTPLKIVKIVKNVSSQLETILHKELEKYKVYGEWFSAATLQYLEQPNIVLEPSKQEKPEQPQIETVVKGEKINHKDNYLNITKDSTCYSLTEETLKEKAIAKLLDAFGKAMGFKPSVGFRVANRDYVILLLQDHSLEDIIKAIEIGKREYKRERKDPAKFITLKSLANSIDRWLIEEKEEKGGW